MAKSEAQEDPLSMVETRHISNRDRVQTLQQRSSKVKVNQEESRFIVSADRPEKKQDDDAISQMTQRIIASNEYMYRKPSLQMLITNGADYQTSSKSYKMSRSNSKHPLPGSKTEGSSNS